MSRPSDFADDGFGDIGGAGAQNPRLGALEWLRWAWRQLTSMRTALLLLLALAVAAVPGSLIPQNSADPNGVLNWKASNPGLVGLANTLQLFDVYTSAWFSAIYLLLFVSLVGCVVPRIAYHLKALRAAPPRTPSRLGRLPAYRSATAAGDRAQALDAGERLLKRRRYRVARYGDSLSAERGYLRETGNLLFHTGLVGVLVAVFVGSGFTYTGQRVTVEGETFVNNQSNYDSLAHGRFFTDSTLQPYSLKLDSLKVKYEQQNTAALGEPLDYTATVTTQVPGGRPVKRIIKVNDPLQIGGSAVYLLGNGYAPHLTVRNADGSIAFSGSVPFRPQGQTMVSLGVVKAEHTTSQKQQIGLVGFLYPTVGKLSTGADTSIFPSLGDPLVSFNVWTGDLGLNSGATQNVYVLDTSGMTQIAGRNKPNKAIQLTRAKPTATLPDGLGTVHLDGISRYAAFDIHHDPSQGWVAGFVVLTVAGLITSLLVPRRRMWLRVTEDLDGELRLEYAALARGDDPGLERAVGEFADEHRRELEAPTPSAERIPAGV